MAMIILFTALALFILFLFSLFKVASDADERMKYVVGGYKEHISHPQEEVSA